MPHALRTLVPAALASLAVAVPATAAPIRIGVDPYTGSTSGQHATAVEPDSFSWGSKIVTAFQVGRFEEGGGANVGWATSADAGKTWKHGVMPGLTTVAGGTHERVTDASVAYDARHSTWLAISDPLGPPPAVRGEAILVNRSADGFSWSKPVVVTNAVGSQDFDKTWVTCDNTPTSPFYGNCYAEFDDIGADGLVLMSTSSDGGKTWGAPKHTPNNATGLAGLPVVQPNGKVVVPYLSADETQLLAFRSIDGGATWDVPSLVSNIVHHGVPGQMRSGPLPSVDTDKDGRIYAAWEDCRFRASCAANDIVISSSTDGIAWSPKPARVPLATVTSDQESFIPGLAVRHASSGDTAHLALAYHYMPSTFCEFDTCQVHVGFSESHDRGATWTTPVDLSGAMKPIWMAATSEGFMTGDYISTSFAGGSPHPVFALARCPVNGRFDEAIYAANPPFGKGGPNCGPPPRARVLTNLDANPFRFAAKDSGPSIVNKGGTLVTYNSSAAGRTRFRIRRSEQRQGSVCGPPVNGKPRTCRVWIRVPGEFFRNDVKGANSFHFSGRLDGKKLRPALYRLGALPKDPNRPPAKTAYTQFRIVSSSRTAW